MFYNQLIGGDSLRTFGERLRELRRENHMPTMGYCIGLDMQHTPLELEAENA